MKIINVAKKTHAYIVDGGVVVRAVPEAQVKDYKKEGTQVYSAPATKLVEGVKTDTTNYYVPVDKFVKRSTAKVDKTVAKLEAAKAQGVDLSKLDVRALAELLS